MAQYTATVAWQRGDQDFLGNRYNRRHSLSFDGGAELLGSSSPHVVPLPLSDAAGVDPEELFVSSLSACHMLWFLSLAARQRFIVDSYTDAATGLLAQQDGRMAMTVVTLHPDVKFSGEHLPTREQLDQLHHRAHAECFIARSVKTEVRCEPRY